MGDYTKHIATRIRWATQAQQVHSGCDLLGHLLPSLHIHGATHTRALAESDEQIPFKPPNA